MGERLNGIQEVEGSNPLSSTFSHLLSSNRQLLREPAFLAHRVAAHRIVRHRQGRKAVAEADLDRVRELLGDDAAKSLERLSQLTKMLEESGLIENKEGRLELTPRGLRSGSMLAKVPTYRMPAGHAAAS